MFPKSELIRIRSGTFMKQLYRKTAVIYSPPGSKSPHPLKL